MRSRPFTFVLVAVLAVAGGCSKDDESPEKAKSGTTSTTVPDDAPSTTDEAPAADAGPTTTLGGPLGSIQPPPPEPKGAAQLTFSRTITGAITADPQVRCVTGDGFFDIDLSFEPSTPLGPELGFVSLTVSANNYRGPGRYGLSATGVESVVLEELETGIDVEFIAPENGAKGLVEIEPGGQKGRFEMRGLLDIDDRPLDVVGSFSCGRMDPM